MYVHKPPPYNGLTSSSMLAQKWQESITSVTRMSNSLAPMLSRVLIGFLHLFKSSHISKYANRVWTCTLCFTLTEVCGLLSKLLQPFSETTLEEQLAVLVSSSFPSCLNTWMLLEVSAALLQLPVFCPLQLSDIPLYPLTLTSLSLHSVCVRPLLLIPELQAAETVWLLGDCGVKESLLETELWLDVRFSAEDPTDDKKKKASQKITLKSIFFNLQGLFLLDFYDSITPYN